MADSAPQRKTTRRGWLATLIVAMLLLAGGLSFGSWIGPSALLRFAVRTADPALRMKMSSTDLHDGELRLRDVQILLRGKKEPIFRAKEVSLGLGKDWRKGRFGSLKLFQPALALDRTALDHFSSGGSGGGWPWEIGEVTIVEGHVWLERFGEPALDISVNVDGTLQHVGPAALEQEHKLDLSGAYVAVHHEGAPVPLFGAGRAEASVSIGGLVDRKLQSLRVDRGWLLAGPGLQALTASAPPAPAATSAPAPVENSAFVLQSLDLVDLQISTGESVGALPEVSFKVNSALRDVGLGSAARDLAEKIHQVEFADVEILSPYDPLKRAVTIRTLFAKFSLAGLARQEIEQLTVLNPTIFVGEALFEYMQQAESPGAPPPEPVEATEGWKTKKLEVNFGRLVIAAGGRSKVGLPLAFQTKAENVSLSSLAGLNLDLVLTIPPDNYDFPAYDLALKNVRGDLRLNYPPDQHANNLVNVVKFDRARWRNFTGRNLWVSVTFDPRGINGLFGGEAYGGYVSGGFSFFLQPDAPWTGWLSATKIDLDGLTADGAPQHFTMTGLADGKIEINGLATRIERVSGNLRGRGKGRMVINKLNDMLAAIPPEWWSLKKEFTRVSLETLRDFDYDAARADFWFVADRGKADVRMKGPAGSRNIDLVLHGDGTGGGVWSQR
ncbi:MAG: hypothetical protein ACKOEI_00090 [Chthoniobacterales bacterium]